MELDGFQTLTSLQVNRVDADICVPALVVLTLPVSLDGATLGQQDDFRQHGRQDQQDDQRPEPLSERLRVLDAQHEQADGDFEQTQDGEEEELGKPGEEVDVFVVGFCDELAMLAVAVGHADDLTCHAANGEQAGGCNGIVVASESSAFGAYKDAQGCGCEDEDQHDDRDDQQGRTGVIVFAGHGGGH